METICANCGCIIEGNAYTIANGDTICEDCVEQYEECADCGELYPRDEMTWTNNGYVCESCSYDYNYCEYCDEMTDREMVHVRYYGNVCEDCAENSDRFVYCEECEEWVLDNDYDYDADMCYSCSQEQRRNVIGSYHSHKGKPIVPHYSHLEMAGYHRKPNWLIGFEWEWTSCEDHLEVAEKLTEILGDRAYHEEDCTVDVETIFEPHSYDAIIESGEIKKAFDYAKTVCDHESEACGLHVHVSRTAFGDTDEEQTENIAKLVLLHTMGHSYKTLVKLSRRTEEGRRWAKAFNNRYTDKEQMIEWAKSYVQYRENDHYVAINCGNRDTVEFRLGAGTVDYENFISWIKIINLLVTNCKNVPIEHANNIYLWLANADDSVKAYMEKRGVTWEEPKVLTEADYSTMLTTLMDKINADLTANGANTMDYNTMLTVLCNASIQTRVALGYA